MESYKFKGGERVKVKTDSWNLRGIFKVPEFTGTVVFMISDLPMIGQSYIVVADHPKEIGLDTEFYPFSAIPVPEGLLTRI